MMRVMLSIIMLVAAAGGGYEWGRYNPPHEGTPATPELSSSGRKLLYYRNPMGLSDVSPVPKKDPMGMDYLPVYEGESPTPSTAGQVVVAAGKMQQLGVKTELVRTQTLERRIQAAGRVELDERRLHAVTTRFEGYIERLHVNVTGQQVSRGDPLFEVYSPELVAAQQEYQVASRGLLALQQAGAEARVGMQQLATAALLRLQNWGIAPATLKRLTSSGPIQRTLTLHAPASGVVLEKKALPGMRVMPGEMLFQIADLSTVWVIADLFEQDAAAVTVGMAATVRLSALPQQSFTGVIRYIYPVLKSDTRTLSVRIELDNPQQQLKPAMLARVEISAVTPSEVVVVPRSAVIDSGKRQVVLLQLDEGRFEPRTVTLGRSSDDLIEVMDGVDIGDQVVVSANFLIDAESNLKAALSSFTAPATSTTTNHTGHTGH
ncbi:MAG: efflux RND transporter periplasmic adaptor subunit [Magnetococcales bacterium]|nr:efflux RND transporter periplasmic adaptor subunit [Magnetococcales bacterium]